jgi:hypothetical protein
MSNGNSPYLTLQMSESENEETIAEEENKDTYVYDEVAKE